MFKWLNPKNGDLSSAAVVVTLGAAVPLAWASWASVTAAGAEGEVQIGAAIIGAMAPIGWALTPSMVFKNRVERAGFIALCVAMSAVALAFILTPQAFV